MIMPDGGQEASGKIVSYDTAAPVRGALGRDPAPGDRQKAQEGRHRVQLAAG